MASPAIIRQAAASEPDPSARAAIRAAWVAAIAAFVAALVSVGGTVYTVKYSANSEDRRSQTEFVRSQRQALYSRIVNENAAASAEEDRLFNLDADYDPEAKKITGQIHVVYSKQLLALVASQGAITVIGSDASRASMDELVGAHYDVEEAVFDYLQASAKDCAAAETNEAYDEVRRAEGNVVAAEEALYVAARADLGTK